MSNFNAILKTVEKNPNDRTIKNLINSIEKFPPSDEEIADLAKCISRTGNTLSELKGMNTADIPSTGGPSSLSTILCPLYLRALGYIVPKLGIPGRPAGGIDVLAQIPGYKINFSIEEIELLLKRSGYVHFIVSQTYAPLDGIIYSYRKQSGKTNIPELAIASLLSKKLAASVSFVGLDVRVAPHGNFGVSFDIAEQNSKRFCNVSKHLCIKAICFLSDASRPYQPFIGRGEALVALYEVVTNQSDQWLSDHNNACFAMAKRLAEIDQTSEQIISPKYDILGKVLSENLDAQGSSFENFKGFALKIKKQHINELRSPHHGFLELDINSLRSLLVELQNKYKTKENQFPDPCGIILKRQPGEYVNKNEILATFRCYDNICHEMLTGLKSAIKISPDPDYDLYFSQVCQD